MKNYTIQSEHQEQVQLIKWCELNRHKYPQLANIYCNANGGHRHITIAIQMKAEGVKPGVPDLFLPYAAHGEHGFYIEMKKRVGGRVSAEQNDWRDRLTANGYRVRVCHGWEEAVKELVAYLTPANPTTTPTPEN